MACSLRVRLRAVNDGRALHLVHPWQVRENGVVVLVPRYGIEGIVYVSSKGESFCASPLNLYTLDTPF